ncbi:VTT domain-containing protein [Dellaglioa algida]|uniref:VTT domain-containing protein n=1 Tax=Dellaglioa algida TaxID=105612 RepID=UPI0024C4CF41|nr:VTT domain-containing protein [Dellaglioa algida]MDK1727228.1 VTT domain-containing protein [Dellaglioa algida]
MFEQAWFLFTHFENYLEPLFQTLGSWSYLTLFVLIFAETGLVIFPFLPGETLLFFTSSIAAYSTQTLDIRVLIPVFFFAALIGDAVNFEIGRHLNKLPFLKNRISPEKMASANIFLKKHGAKTVIFGRFVPLIRTFVPLISGSARMSYRHFGLYNFIGVTLWVALGAGIGYYFGALPFVKDHFSVIFISIAGIALIPSILAGLLHLFKFITNKKARS